MPHRRHRRQSLTVEQQNLRTTLRKRKKGGFGVPRFVPKWRATVDEDGHYSFAVAL
jgi:hypothetical protein